MSDNEIDLEEVDIEIEDKIDVKDEMVKELNISKIKKVYKERAKYRWEKCDECVTEDSNFHCYDCGYWYCNKCWKKVHNHATLRNHKKSTHESICRIHESKIMAVCLKCYYDKNVCCAFCLMDDDPAHEFKRIDALEEEKGEIIKQRIDSLNTEIEELKKKISELESNKETLTKVSNLRGVDLFRDYPFI